MQASSSEVIGSVLVDRAVGLLGWWCGGVELNPVTDRTLSQELIWIRRGSWVMLSIGLGALAAVVAFGKYLPFHWLGKIPIVGHAVYRMAHAGLIFDRRPWLVIELLLFSCVVHAGLTLSTYLISCSLYFPAPSIADHFMVIPPAFAAGALP